MSCLYLEINVGWAFTVAQLYILDIPDSGCYARLLCRLFANASNVHRVFVSIVYTYAAVHSICVLTHIWCGHWIFSMQLLYLAVSFINMSVYVCVRDPIGCSFLHPLSACIILVFRFDRRVHFGCCLLVFFFIEVINDWKAALKIRIMSFELVFCKWIEQTLIHFVISFKISFKA